MSKRPPVISFLAAYAMKQASVEDVMRGLMEHDDWLVPASVLKDQAVAASLVVFGEVSNLPAGELWVFTEEACARVALEAGVELGTYVKGNAGADVFGESTNGITRIRVNPGCPSHETWGMENADAVGAGRDWARAIALEERASAKDAIHDPEVQALLANHPEYLAVSLGNLTSFFCTRDKEGNWPELFVAPDCAMRIADLLTEQKSIDAKVQAIRKDAFADTPIKGVAGVCLNLGSRGRVKIPSTLCEKISAIAKA